MKYFDLEIEVGLPGNKIFQDFATEHRDSMDYIKRFLKIWQRITPERATRLDYFVTMKLGDLITDTLYYHGGSSMFQEYLDQEEWDYNITRHEDTSENITYSSKWYV